MNLFRNFVNASQAFLFETPDPAGGGGAGTAPAPGTPPQGQGQPAPGGMRGMFPNVPDEQWAVIEPHIGQVQGHVTRLEQQVAPLKPLLDKGYTAQSLEGLVNFDQRFNANPLETWLELGNALQQSQNGQAPAIHPDVDLEYLAAIARGEDPDAGSVPGTQPGADPAAGGQNPEVQQLMARIQAQQAQIEQLTNQYQQDRVQQQTSVHDRFFGEQLGKMREVLKGSGWPEELLDERMLTSIVVTHKGNFQAAAKALIDQRTALLKGLTDGRNQPNPPTTLPNGAPNTPSRDVPARDRGDGFKTATRSAEARLKRLNGQG